MKHIHGVPHQSSKSRQPGMRHISLFPPADELPLSFTKEGLQIVPRDWKLSKIAERH